MYGVGAFKQNRPVHNGTLRFPRVQTADYQRWPVGIPAGQYGGCAACMGEDPLEVMANAAVDATAAAAAGVSQAAGAIAPTVAPAAASSPWLKYAILGVGAFILLKFVL